MNNTESNLPEFLSVRTLEAPRDVVFKAWTERDQLARWWGPKGLELGIAKLDLRPGGIFHYSMKLPNGSLMWGRFIYEEIQPPQRLAYVSSFSDPEGNIAPAPFPGKIPLIHTVVTFDDIPNGTRQTLRARPHNATQEEIDTFASMQSSLNAGFNGTFDQLVAYLKTL
ncbi:MAG TPA: SRPBCC domain-containing protein [Methylomirabilota bacterium]|nr:SRPBCC domain-containing protein [Methylomirabilota bacterium]